MSTLYPDVSEILRGDALAAEDRVWVKLISEKEQLAKDLRWTPFRSVLEIGCGTGLYARILREAFPGVDYLGVDSNLEALTMAQERNVGVDFICSDFRCFLPPGTSWDLVCAHAFLKHFSIDEWPSLFLKFLSLGRAAQFDMQTALSTLNDGSPTFGNNLWVAESLFEDLLSQSSHVIKSSRVAWQQGDRRATIYLTERREERNAA